VVVDVLGEVLADYRKLASTYRPDRPGAEDIENPSISDLTQANARVIYFWEGQQVLCATMKKCLKTPGWKRAPLANPDSPVANFAFGPPMPFGSREASDIGFNFTFEVRNKTWNATDRVMEPLCMNPSNLFTGSEYPTQLLNKLRKFSDKIVEVAARQAPFCYPAQTELPPLHAAPMLHRLDAWVDMRLELQQAFAELLLAERNLWVRGEALTARSTAERVNYMLLLWYFSRDNVETYTKANVIAMDYVHPVLLGRMIASQQEVPECGFVVSCRDSGSCFAQDLHAYDGRCEDLYNSGRFLTNYAEGCIFSWKLRFFIMSALFFVSKMLTYVAFTKTPSKDNDVIARLLHMGAGMDPISESDEEFAESDGEGGL